MLLDSGYIHEKDAEYLNKKRQKQGQPSIEPLYTKEDAARVGPLFKCLDYEEVFQPAPGVKANPGRCRPHSGISRCCPGYRGRWKNQTYCGSRAILADLDCS